eukprot:gene153-biopygen381
MFSLYMRDYEITEAHTPTAEEFAEFSNELLSNYFIMCVIWGVGASVTADTRPAFAEVLWQLVAEHKGLLTNLTLKLADLSLELELLLPGIPRPSSPLMIGSSINGADNRAHGSMGMAGCTQGADCFDDTSGAAAGNRRFCAARI